MDLEHPGVSCKPLYKQPEHEINRNHINQERKSGKSGKIAGKVSARGVLMRGAKQNFKYASNELL
jgi:hypothetical protein